MKLSKFITVIYRLNGDLAVLPILGVAGIIPKIENIKEDFAKVLTDWQEHIGYLQVWNTDSLMNLIILIF